MGFILQLAFMTPELQFRCKIKNNHLVEITSGKKLRQKLLAIIKSRHLKSEQCCLVCCKMKTIEKVAYEEVRLAHSAPLW